MKKPFLLALFVVATLARAAETPAPAPALTATITDETRLDLIKTKGSILLKKGSTVDVVGRDGDTLEVIYRNISGHVPAGKTDFKGEVPKGTVKPKPESKPTIIVNPPSAPPKPADPKADASAPAPSNRDAPQSMYGKMVKKARDNEEKHKENLVDPANEVTGGKAKE